MKPKLIVALDVKSIAEIRRVVNALPRQIEYYKVGLELFAGTGSSAVEYLRKKNKKIFLDLKLHDIPRTVARAVASASSHGVNMLTVHAAGGRDMLKAAAESARELGASAPKLIAVTTLTSLNQNDLSELGIIRPLLKHTLALGKLAIDCGIDGIVCSPLEARNFRKKLGSKPILVTPGIRLRPDLKRVGTTAGQVRHSETSTDDQKRIATPEMAIKAGANFLVVGRPILEAPDPAKAAEQILKEMKNAVP